MAEFILIQTILNLFWAISWSQKDLGNIIVKVGFWCLVATGVYLLFGPTNAIGLLSR